MENLISSAKASFDKPFFMEAFAVAACNIWKQRNLKWRSGQRSRVRKLQYIADLERTVDSLQIMGADLAVRVASHFQLRNALSIENKQLRRQIASLQQAKLMKDVNPT
ncbi:hypothetical protein TRIUR3_32634 [Triticum urartu]|uniref:BZIP domain-containing protein n=2 Tax=Triticum TaxID=4564 RepID=A0A9R0Y094_TRITD|nr:hypothetical protein TRIUR3_32634 [Triticum urartu]VAI46351.1 unnamed protein product [Triticum turgidum subsp. durum]